MTRHRPGHAVTLAVAVALLLAGASPAVATSTRAPDRWDGDRAGPAGPRVPSGRVAGTAPAAVSMLASDPQVPLEPCDDDPGWLCGSIRVPVDRAEPDGRSIPVGFQVFPHRSKGPGARDAIIASTGGPGFATSSDRSFFQFIMDPVLDRRDLVLVDHRGTGASGPLDCPGLQDGVTGRADFLDEVGECGRLLGDDADRYGTGDVALDVEDVRRALGYRQISYYGHSYGAVAAQAYAVRFPERLRAVVTDAGVAVGDPQHSYLWAHGVGRALQRMVRLSCARVRACDQANPRATTALGRLIRTLRREPVIGAARGLDGERRRVRVDEATLAVIILSHTHNPGEIPAVAAALADGDRRPLLRLAAETSLWPGPEGETATYSAGTFAAAFCNDLDTVWRRSDAVPVRQQAYEQALAARPAGRFAPFSKEAITHAFPPDLCLQWPAPDRFTPAVPRGATAEGFPVLQLAGDLDGNVPIANARRIRTVFPQAQVVTLQGSPHTPHGWSGCARLITQRFLETLRTGGTGCARNPSFVAAAVSETPRRASVATPATRLARDDSRALDRRVSAVAVRTVLDAWLRSFRIPGSVADGTGLRGGDFDFDYDSFGDHAVVHLDRARFARDVTVTGRSRRSYADNGVHLSVRVDGPGRHDGRLRAHGSWGFGPPFRAVEVTGTLGGRSVHLSVPAG